MKRNITAVIVLIVMTPILFARHTRFPKIENEPVILGLDHIPIAVTDLDKAVSLFEELGFTLKPGRFHENGIRNSHIKFKDGTEIEIISVEENRDALTAEYLNHLQLGDGPVFVGFYAARLEYLSEWFDQAELAHQIEGGLLTFPESSSLRYIFFGRRQASPTDKPENFIHENGADGLVSVWLAGDEFDLEEELFSMLGIEISEMEVYVPLKTEARVAKFKAADVILLPGSFQVVPGRRIIGATMRTIDLNGFKDLLENGSRSNYPEIKTENWQSIFIPPDVAHGMWLELREYLED